MLWTRSGSSTLSLSSDHPSTGVRRPVGVARYTRTRERLDRQPTCWQAWHTDSPTSRYHDCSWAAPCPVVVALHGCGPGHSCQRGGAAPARRVRRRARRGGLWPAVVDGAGSALRKRLSTAARRWGRGGISQASQVLVTAGGTQEAIDPVRYISNHSWARWATRSPRPRAAGCARGAGNDANGRSATPGGMKMRSARTCSRPWLRYAALDALIMCAAVADFASIQRQSARSNEVRPRSSFT